MAKAYIKNTRFIERKSKVNPVPIVKLKGTFLKILEELSKDNSGKPAMIINFNARRKRKKK